VKYLWNDIINDGNLPDLLRKYLHYHYENATEVGLSDLRKLIRIIKFIQGRGLSGAALRMFLKTIGKESAIVADIHKVYLRNKLKGPLNNLAQPFQ